MRDKMEKRVITWRKVKKNCKHFERYHWEYDGKSGIQNACNEPRHGLLCDKKYCPIWTTLPAKPNKPKGEN